MVYVAKDKRAICSGCGEFRPLHRGPLCKVCRTSDPDKFWSRVDRRGPDECWPWKLHYDKDGYGRTVWKAAMRAAHRIAWELANGSKPTVCVCHSCDNPPCCNPAHLWLGTHDDNMRDKVLKGRANSANRRKTHCSRGHPYDEKNTYRLTIRGRNHRYCRACSQIAAAAYNRRKREARLAEAQGLTHD